MAIAEARAKFAAAEAAPAARGGVLTSTLLLDQDAINKQRQAAFARLQSQPPVQQQGVTAEAKQRKLEQLALQGVREIARALLPNAGALEEPEDLVRFLSKLRDTIEVFLRCFIPLRDGYQQFASQMRIHQDSAGRVESASDERQLAQHLPRLEREVARHTRRSRARSPIS